MRRRDFVKAMMAAGVSARAALGQQAPPAAPPVLKPTVSPNAPVAPAPMPMMRGLQEVKPLPMLPLSADAIGGPVAQFFSAGQMATLRRLGEIFQPAHDGHPGSTEAGAPEFLDFLISVSPIERQRMYREGLDRLDKEAHSKFGVAFSAVTEAQADQLIRPWLRTWMTDHPPTEPYAQFINLAHLDIRTATANSQAAAETARKAGQQPPNVDLYWYPVVPDVLHEGAEADKRRVH